MRAFVRFIKLVVTIAAVFLIISTITLGTVYFYFAHDLPNIRSFEDYKPPVVSEVFSDNGTKMGEFWIEQRYLAAIDEIPKVVIQAFVAAEDSRFFEHKGVDVRGIGRAFYENLKAGQIVQGGSTITQQVTRSILLSRERSYIRKIKEAILATRIDRNLSKREILEIYLNQIFLGNRAYGVKAAAKNYFHKELQDVTLAEASLIAGLTQAPGMDNPLNSPELARERQKYVLSRMVDVGYISKREERAALDEVITIYGAGIDKEYNVKYAPYFTEHIRRMILDKYGEQKLYEGGLKVYTTANIELNRAAQKAVKFGLEELDHRRGYRGPVGTLAEDEIPAFLERVHNESTQRIMKFPVNDESVQKTTLNLNEIYEAVVWDFKDKGKTIVVKVGHNTGDIPYNNYKWAWHYLHRFKKGDIVMIEPTDTEGVYILSQIPKAQGALFSMEPGTGFVKAMSGGFDFRFSEFNRATQALRQPGSSFKPIIYSAALDKGFTYSTPVLDAPITYKVGDEIWTPKNYGGKYSGPTQFMNNLVYSKNVPTVRIADIIGTHYIVAFARKLGLTNHFYKYLSMALGANSVYLEEMVTAFSTLANYGRKPERVFILRMEDENGHVLEEYIPPPPQLDVTSAYQQTLSTSPDSLELNSKLFEKNEHWIGDDGLQLTDEELRILYGRAIPNDYVMSPQTAYMIVNLLTEVVQRGTGVRVQALGRPVAGKTGTTNEETDAWFIGFVPQLAAGAWVGHDVKKTLGRGEQGGRTAAPIFIEYMKVALKDLPVEQFTPPEGFPVETIATLSGGSAIYYTGPKKPEGDTWFGVTHEVKDRAVDFFEEDIGF